MIKDAFLSQVAINLAEKYKGDFTNLNIIFTNQRAKVFFNEALYNHLQKPFFSPQYYTINDFVSKYSSLIEAEEVVLTYYLYEVYSEVFYRDKPSMVKETFEEFYYWGIMLLKDFDDIDKNLANAENVFKNIEDYKEIENSFDFLSVEQKELLKEFFNSSFRFDSSSEIKERFINVWNCLFEIYSLFKKKLREKGIGYSGMLYRDLVENLSELEQKEDRVYCFVGFNVLNNVEKEIFSWLRNTYETRFYWDFDNYYVNNQKQEAGLFLRENIKNFPMPNDFEINTNNILSNNLSLEIISCPNENSQTGYISQWLEKLSFENKDLEQKDIAILLCNEDLLPSVLNALPPKIGNETTKVNITMGYKFQLTSLFTLIDSYLNYQNSLSKHSSPKLKNLLPFVEHNYFKGEYSIATKELINNNAIYLSDSEINSFNDISSLLNLKSKPLELISALKDITKIVADKNTNEEIASSHQAVEEVLAESLYRFSNVLNNLEDLFKEEKIDLKASLLYNTIRSALNSIIVPFEGDPINGIQIMGILESRSLDFKHILFLSANDDSLPNISIDSSFIPFTIRKAYNLTTIERKIAVFAYYFYRLLQHSESIHFLYNATSSDTKPKEMSRFIQQLRIETNKEFKYNSISCGINSPKEKVLSFNREQQHVDKILKKSESKFLSPTYINDYLNCQLKFFFKQIIGLTISQEFDEEMQDNVFGTIFHACATQFYNEIKEKTNTKEITKKDIEFHSKNIKRIVDENFEIEYLKIKQRKSPKIEYNQIQNIKKEILIKYLRKLIEIDKNYAPFNIIAMEEGFDKTLEIDGKEIKLGGYIDRIDLKFTADGDAIVRVLDYKTNNYAKKEVRLDQIFFNDNETKKRNDYFFQAFFYSWLITNNQKLQELIPKINSYKIKPEILYIKTSTIENQISDIYLLNDDKGRRLIDDFDEIYQYFEDNLISCLKDILLLDNSSTYSQNKNDCEYCDFHSICY
ncbi:MAG: PD-(D/E)XK nuclease family protein [Bacteroidales bacterium]|nr:PD-(D/E)XK nuclease family protein [Bacteroidales bacterium]